MKLSIIIPLYNSELYLDQCMNSLMDQNLETKDFEIILINDGSNDNSYSIARSYCQNYSNIRLLNQRNQGVSIARNNGLKNARGQYVYFVDSDDYVAQNTLPMLLETIYAHNLDILEFKNIRSKFRNYKFSYNLKKLNNAIEVLSGNKYLSKRPFHDALWVYIFKREMIINSKILFSEGRTKQDMLFVAEIIFFAKRIAFYPLDVYRYVINPNSITTNLTSHSVRRSIEDFIFITKKYKALIEKYEIAEKVDTHILRKKQQTQLFNIFKAILYSDLKKQEIISVVRSLSEAGLYPAAKYYGKNKWRKLYIYIFNNFYLLLFFIHFFRILKPFFNFLIKNLTRQKKELKISSNFKNVLN